LTAGVGNGQLLVGYSRMTNPDYRVRKFRENTRINHLSQGGFVMSLSEKLLKIGGPVLTLCILVAVPVVGSTTAYADGDGGTPPAASTTPPPAGTDGNPWHG
jgi:hypothetical protein